MAEAFLPHILLGAGGQTERYKGAGFPRKTPLPARDRQAHGAKLSRELRLAWQDAQARRTAPGAVGVASSNGIFLEFRSEPGFSLTVESLERSRHGIELRNVRVDGGITLATVFVPDGKLGVFLKLIESYLTKDTEKGRPKHSTLVDSISEIRLAALESFWTDPRPLFPGPGQSIWWEIWLRGGRETFDAFVVAGRAAGLLVDERSLPFPERVVALAYATAEDLSRLMPLLENLAELRRGAKSAASVRRLPRQDQKSLLDGLLRRVEFPPLAAPAVCVLDTGMNREHPLLAPVLDPSDVHSCDPSWGRNDHSGHGTQMGGLAIYGDLTQPLTETSPLVLQHRLESVKLLPPDGGNDPEFYGALTIEAAARAEVQAPDRARSLCLAVSAPYQLAGRPTSWSAAIDKVISGADDEQRRLLFVSAGNSSLSSRHLYPASNETESVQDPAQAWNAITVGAATGLTRIEDPDFAGWRPLAPAGGLGPSSTTSVTWGKAWPMKPDIVLEGGNMVLSPDGTRADYADELQLLAVSHHPQARYFVVSGDTSAGTALAARMGAVIQARYPQLWPETVRGLLVHSAEHTSTMKEQFGGGKRSDLERLLRCCGYGLPDLSAALSSGRSAVTLVVQDEIQPFENEKMKEMKLHPLPWPRDVLLDLGELPVELRVTLSYFIEPNPGERGWVRKFSYMSHGLRLEVKTAEESVVDFRKRLNRAAREEEKGGVATSSGAEEWLYGPTLRRRGSIHSDRWSGTAARLAERGLIGVYPVMGWWRERPHLGRSNRKARYALVVTIRTASAEIDIYTVVANQVAIAVAAR
jgi:hypothetical protein